MHVRGGSFQCGLGDGTGLIMSVIGGTSPKMQHREVHKWFGLSWRMDLDFRLMLQGKVRHADGLIASLAGLVSSGSLPLAVAASLFEGKVDGYLRFGRWLTALAWGAETAYDKAYVRLARASLGWPHWRSRAVAVAELGRSCRGLGMLFLTLHPVRHAGGNYWQVIFMAVFSNCNMRFQAPRSPVAVFVFLGHGACQTCPSLASHSGVVSDR